MNRTEVKNKIAKGKSRKADATHRIFTFNFLLLPFFVLSLGVLLVNSCAAQTGGGFDLSHNVIAAGGGRSAAGGFAIEGTAGQPSAGTISAGSSYSARGGFWAFQTLAPTAAQVSVAGRVSTASGLGIRNASIRLTAADGAIRFTQTGSFGFFRFEGVAVGATYVLEVSSKRFTFAAPIRVLSVAEAITDADFIAEPE